MFNIKNTFQNQCCGAGASGSCIIFGGAGAVRPGSKPETFLLISFLLLKSWYIEGQEPEPPELHQNVVLRCAAKGKLWLK
jgi:hypothetical protein